MELAVSTVSASLTFYHDIIGMDIIEMMPDDEHLATWAEVDYRASRLMIQQRSELDIEIPAAVGRSAGAALMVVRVTGRAEAEEIWRKVQSSAIKVAQAPKETDYGTHEFSVLDPDGYIVLVAASAL